MCQKHISDKGVRASEVWAEIHLRIEGKHKFYHFFLNDTLSRKWYGGRSKWTCLCEAYGWRSSIIQCSKGMTWGLPELRSWAFSGNAALLLPAAFPNLLGEFILRLSTNFPNIATAETITVVWVSHLVSLISKCPIWIFAMELLLNQHPLYHVQGEKD